MKSVLPLLTSLTVLSFAPAALAGTPPVSADKTPVAPAVTPPADAWTFSLTVPGWLAGLEGDFGLGGFQPVHADVPFSKILENLDMVAGLTVEAQRGPWSFYVDGLYLKLSSGGETPGRLLNTVNVEMSQVLVETGLAYRLWEGERGYFDLLAGARYFNMDGTIRFDVDGDGVREVSQDLAAEATDRVVAAAKGALSAARPKIASAARSRIESEVQARVKQRIADVLAVYPNAPETIREFINSGGTLSDETKQLIAAKLAETQATVEETTAAATAAAAAAKSRVKRQLSAAVARAEKRLARRIEKEIHRLLPDEASGSKGWVDPFIGFRARYNFTSRFFATARGDVGGFGVGSDLAWQAAGTLGYQFNANWSAELGYRYLSMDYADGGFVYDAAMGGVFTGLKYTF